MFQPPRGASSLKAVLVSGPLLCGYRLFWWLELARPQVCPKPKLTVIPVMGISKAMLARGLAGISSFCVLPFFPIAVGKLCLLL